MADKPPVPRVVKHRRTGHVHRPIVVLDLEEGTGYSEALGEATGLDRALAMLPAMPSALVVTMDSARLLAILEDLYGEDPRWQYRVTPLKRQVMKSNGEVSKWKAVTTLVNFFGWQRVNGHKENLYHYPLDPSVFSRAGVSELLPPGVIGVEDRVPRLLQWGQDVRAWCAAQDLTVSPTSGGLAAQLLKDPRWFPAERRKVPRRTNERVRPKLPGNYYRLLADTGTVYDAHYLDMHSSHHAIAQTTVFPHPDTLTARGYFDVSTDAPGVTVSDGRPWVKAGTPAFERLTTEAIGLLYVRLQVPTLREDQFPLPYMRHPGGRMAWIYTNEIPLIHALGGRIEHITAAWISFTPDPSLNSYARFALARLEEASADRKRWLKPTLLSAYGILAANPVQQEFGYRRAKGGEDRAYPAGSSMLPVKALIGRGERESPLVNVMYRGLIEAEQRRRAIDMARLMSGYGFRVLAIYADSVFLETGPALPLLPAGWRVEAHLDALVFNSSTHFTSRQLTKLPGIKRDTIERVELMARIRGHRV